MYHVLIVEDSADEARILEGHLRHYAHEHELEFDVERLSSATELLGREVRADLIFMDISLPGMNGMEAARLMRANGCQIPLVFVTNLAQYAMRGYQVDALGFVVKSSSYGDFSLCMNRAVRALSRNEQRALSIPTQDGLRMLAVSEFVSISAHGRDLSFHLSNGEELSARMPLADLEEQLGACKAPVARISLSCLVNISHIHRLAGSDLLMDDGSVLHISHGRKAVALASIASYLGGGA